MSAKYVRGTFQEVPLLGFVDTANLKAVEEVAVKQFSLSDCNADGSWCKRRPIRPKPKPRPWDESGGV